VCRIDGIRCLRAERLIIEAPLFDFTCDEMENAIDSAIRLRTVAEDRLRARVERERSLGVNGGRVLVDALVDAGGESKLERAFLRVLRLARLPRPRLQVSHRDGRRLIARVDTMFGPELIIEVEGHATHSSRQQRQADEERRTELTLRGKRVLVFTYNDVIRRPEWTAARVRQALATSLRLIGITGVTARRVGRARRSGFDEDALAGALLGGLDDAVELVIRDVGHSLGALRVALGGGEDLAVLHDVGEAVVEQREDVRRDLLAQAVPCAEILIDPDLHDVAVSSVGGQTQAV